MIERPENAARQPDYLAYLVRLWRMEGSAGAWRGSVESPQTGERLGFGSLDELFAFLRAQTGTTISWASDQTKSDLGRGNMMYEFNQAISKMDEFKAEAQVLIPVLQAARAELGEERANRLILGALRAWCRERFKQMGAGIPGTPREKWEAIKKLDGARTRDHDLEFSILKWEPEAIEYDVSRCLYAELFRELGEPELGAVLVCDADLYLVEQVTGPEVEYRRTQSIMQGGSFCDIRWCIRSRGKAKAKPADR